MDKLDCNKIVELSCDSSIPIEKRMEDMYVKIGKHLINNAKRLSSDCALFTGSIELKIRIDPEEIIVLEKKIKEYIVEE